MYRIRTLLTSALALVTSLSCTFTPVSPPPSPSPFPLSVEGDLSDRGFVESLDGRFRVIGRSGLLVTIATMPGAPLPPPGWLLVSPVFNVTARDRQRRPVVRLPDPVTLRFQVPDRRPSSILVHDGTQWVIVSSELDEVGDLTATVEHLTPYAAARPAGSALGSGAATTPSIARASPPATFTQPRPASSPNGSPTVASGGPVPTISPGAGATAVSTTAPAAADAVLRSSIAMLKDRTVKVSLAGGYEGWFQVGVLNALQQALSAAVSGGGTAYYGRYNALNEAVTVQATGGGAGSLTLLIEPKTAMPVSSTDAQNQIKSYFPGVRVSLAEVSATSTGYVFGGTDGATSYALGFVSYDGTPVAYVLLGSGSFQRIVPRG